MAEPDTPPQGCVWCAECGVHYAPQRTGLCPACDPSYEVRTKATTEAPSGLTPARVAGYAAHMAGVGMALQRRARERR